MLFQLSVQGRVCVGMRNGHYIVYQVSFFFKNKMLP